MFQTNTIDENESKNQNEDITAVGSPFIWLYCFSTVAKVSLDFKNERVEKVLASIKSQTGMSLVFSDQLVDVNRKVTMQLKDVTLKEALTRLLSGTDLTFEIRNNKIYFIEKKAVSRPGSKKKRVTGVVKDVMGEPLIGANVVEKVEAPMGLSPTLMESLRWKWTNPLRWL